MSKSLYSGAALRSRQPGSEDCSRVRSRGNAKLILFTSSLFLVRSGWESDPTRGIDYRCCDGPPWNGGLGLGSVKTKSKELSASKVRREIRIPPQPHLHGRKKNHTVKVEPNPPEIFMIFPSFPYDRA